LTPALVDSLGGPDLIRARYGAFMVGIPAARRPVGAAQLAAFVNSHRFAQPVIDYRPLIGEFASASAVAVCLAVAYTRDGAIPGPPGGVGPIRLGGKGILVLGFGNPVTAVEVLRR
ncbi:MAG: hypothetical protein WAL90_14770, partial [Desulfobacterales bacterium]